MNFVSLGDMGRFFVSTRNSASLKTDLNRLTKELSTGQVADKVSHLKGEMGRITSIDRRLSALEGYSVAAKEAEFRLANIQNALTRIQSLGEEISADFTALIYSGSAGNADLAADRSAEAFDEMLGLLNAQAAGQSLFSGTATNGPAVASLDVFRTELTAAVALETTATGVKAAIDAWFDTPGGGFETLGYIGDDGDLAQRAVGPNDRVTFDARADQTEIRAALKTLALGFVVSEGALAGDAEQRSELLQQAGLDLIGTGQDLTTVRARVGEAEARVDSAVASNSAETTMLMISRNDLISADPFAVAAELDQVELQLETHYTLAARLSRLTLLEYIR